MARNENKTPKNYEAIAAKAPTQLHEDFAQWLYVQTGVRVDLKRVQLVTVLRHDFQASPENQKALADRKAKAAAAKKASAERKKAKLEKMLAEIKGEAKTEEPKQEAAPVAEEPKAEPMEPVKLTVVYSEGGDPEIHKFGCADLKKMTRQKGFRKETANVGSYTALTHLIYPDQAEEDFDGCYLAFDMKPCCPSLDD